MPTPIPLALCRAAVLLAEDGIDLDQDALGLLALAPGAASRTVTGWCALYLALRAACSSP